MTALTEVTLTAEQEVRAAALKWAIDWNSWPAAHEIIFLRDERERLDKLATTISRELNAAALERNELCDEVATLTSALNARNHRLGELEGSQCRHDLADLERLRALASRIVYDCKICGGQVDLSSPIKPTAKGGPGRPLKHPATASDAS